MVHVYRIPPKQKRNFFSNFSVNTNLIFINVICFFVFALLIFFNAKFLDYIALKPSNILQEKYLWTFLTSMFMHAGFFHIFANMFSLFFIGGFLEKLIGKKRFFWIYIFSGLVGGLFYVIASIIFGGVDIPAVGASGAIFGLLGVLAVLVPYSRIYLIAGPLVLIVVQVAVVPFLPVAISSGFGTIINILILIQIFALFSPNPSFRKFAVPVELSMWMLPIIAIVPLSIIGLFVKLPIGNSAHFGGLVLGLIYGFYLRKKFPRKTERLSRFFH